MDYIYVTCDDNMMIFISFSLFIALIVITISIAMSKKYPLDNTEKTDKIYYVTRESICIYKEEPDDSWGEKIAEIEVPKKVLYNVLVTDCYYDYDFYIRKDILYLNGYVYRDGKWKKSLRSILWSRKFNDNISGISTVSALLAAIVVAPVALLYDAIKSKITK